MTNAGKGNSAQKMRPRRWHAAVALLLFVAGFAIANRFQLTHAVLYRLAAGDNASAAMAFLFLSAQATALLAATWLLPPRWFAATMLLAGPSILANIGFGQVVGTSFDAATLAWMIAEARQAPAAAEAFAAPLLLAGAQMALATALLVAARALARGRRLLPQTRRLLPALLILLILPSLIYRLATVWPESAERNLYGFAWDIATAGPPPSRQQPALRPKTDDRPRHILWLIDESVASAPFERIVEPRIANIPHLDFGPAAALGHCSAPAHVALRAGVDVRHAGPTTDLRRTPSIWAYAKRAHYRTLLIDGQTAGAPQNLLLPPERALIDDMWSMASGIDTDLKIADRLNAIMKGSTPTFGYAILRGVHFQYRDHYPPGALPANAPVAQQYDTALAWSKTRFFARLLDGVDRRNVAIVYTSDHGQNLAPGALPHCSRTPVPDEFRVPLLAFLPERLAGRYAAAPRAGHSASQILPATLGWMGYDPASVDARYDHDLTQPTARYVWFGRAVIPFAADDTIAVTSRSGFPGTR
jgi:hypothetical protein